MSANNPKLRAELSKHLYADSKLAFLAVDEEFRVLEVSENCELFLGRAPNVGDLLHDVADFTVGLEFDSSVRWPIIENAGRLNLPMALTTVSYEGKLYLLMTDASASLAQQEKLQQIANDNELLAMEKQALLLDLERKSNALEQASRLQTAFLAGVAHEFRTPLVSILGYSDLIENTFEADRVLASAGAKEPSGANSENAKARQWVRGIQRSGRHLLSLIENLLDHGKGQSEQLRLNYKAVNLKSLLEDIELVMTPQSKQKGLEFVTELNGCSSLSDCWVMVDPDRLTQCLINLVGNAIKFTDSGRVKVLAEYHDQTLKIVIDDTGIGMDEQALLMIREPFWQAHHEQRPGTGLGVTITDGIIDLMGGSLNISSTLNEGTRIEISLPLVTTNEQAQEEAKKQDLDGLQCRVLMVEDDDDIAWMLEALLCEKGFDVARAVHGQQALELAHQLNF